jgi:hypothetical protein
VRNGIKLNFKLMRCHTVDTRMTIYIVFRWTFFNLV